MRPQRSSLFTLREPGRNDMQRRRARGCLMFILINLNCCEIQLLQSPQLYNSYTNNNSPYPANTDEWHHELELLRKKILII